MFKLLFLVQLAYADQSTVMILSNICYSCHGTKRNGIEQIARIDHMNAKQLLRQLKAFKEGKRESTIMQRIVKGLSGNEIKSISEYIAKNAR